MKSRKIDCFSGQSAKSDTDSLGRGRKKKEGNCSEELTDINKLKIYIQTPFQVIAYSWLNQPIF